MSPPPPGPPSPPPSAPSPTASCCGRPATVRHERHLQGAIIAGRDRGARPVSAARLLQPVRLRGARARYSDAAAARRIGVCAPIGVRDGSLTLRRPSCVGVRPQRRRGSISRAAAIAPRGRRRGQRHRTIRRQTPRRPYLSSAEPEPSPPRSMRWGGRRRSRGGRGRQERPAGPPDAGQPGPGTGAAADRVRARRRPLRAEGGHRRRRQQGLEQLRGLLSTWTRRSVLVGRLVKEGGREPATSAHQRGRRQPPRTPTSERATEQRSGRTPRVRRSPPAPLNRRERFGRHRSPRRRRAPRRRRPAEPLPGRSRRAPPLRRRSHALRQARFRRLSEDTCGNATAGGCSYVDPQTGRRCQRRSRSVPHALGGGADPRNLSCVANRVTRRAIA